MNLLRIPLILKTFSKKNIKKKPNHNGRGKLEKKKRCRVFFVILQKVMVYEKNTKFVWIEMEIMN